MGGGGSQPTYVQNDYQETMREALQAQIDLAPDLFYNEANQDFGRPAYARLNQQLVQEGLFGSRVNVDSDGYTTDFRAGAVPEGGFKIATEKEKYTRYLEDNPDVARVIASGRDPDGSSADWARGKEPWQNCKNPC